ncbi:MAG: hypothetical protein ABMA01_22695 [Chthoniobacteraceae bacterium]
MTNIFSAAVAAWRRWKWSRLTDGQRRARKVIHQMSPKERAELDRELEGLAGSRAESRRLQRAHRLQEREKSEAGHERLADYRDEHAREMKQIAEGKRGKYVKVVHEPFRNLLRIPLLFFTLRISRTNERRMEFRHVDNPSVRRLWMGAYVITLLRAKR